MVPQSPDVLGENRFIIDKSELHHSYDFSLKLEEHLEVISCDWRSSDEYSLKIKKLFFTKTIQIILYLFNYYQKS